MRWLKPSVRNSFYALLGGIGGSAPRDDEEDLDDIRDAMLRTLGDNPSRRQPQLCRRIRYAKDIVALWYLRGELMQALSERYGERHARKLLNGITERFDGLLPGALQSRPSPLMS